MSPIRVARSVLIHQSIADRFSVAFRDQVARNGAYTQPPGSPVSHVTFLLSAPLMLMSHIVIKYMYAVSNYNTFLMSEAGS